MGKLPGLHADGERADMGIARRLSPARYRSFRSRLKNLFFVHRGSSFRGGQRPSLAHYVTGIGPMEGATAAGGRSCCLSSMAGRRKDAEWEECLRSVVADARTHGSNLSGGRDDGTRAATQNFAPSEGLFTVSYSRTMVGQIGNVGLSDQGVPN